MVMYSRNAVFTALRVKDTVWSSMTVMFVTSS